MNAISPKHMYIWMLFAASALFTGRAAAQNVDFGWGTSVMGVPAEKAYRNVKKVNNDYVYITDSNTFNLSRFYRKYGAFKNAAEYMKNNKPSVQHDTMDIRKSIDDGAFLSGMFFADPGHPENTKIVLYHYMAGYSQGRYIKKMEQKLENVTGHERDALIHEIEKIKELQIREQNIYKPYTDKFSALEKHSVFWHEYKHYLNRILLYENINNMTRGQIVLFEILDELSADIQGRLMAGENNLSKNIEKAYQHIMDYSDEFHSCAKIDMIGYYYQKPTDKDFFKKIVAEMLQFYVDEKNTVRIDDINRIISMAKKTPFYKKITKYIARVGNTNRFAKAFATGGEDAYNREVEAMIEIANQSRE